MDDLVQQLRTGLDRPLPGREAQFRLAHVARRLYMDAPPQARRAAVLALLYPKNNSWHITLIERTSHNAHDRHSGQISFPGGSYDPADASLMHTALREAEEEIGVRREQVRVLGALTDLYIPVSNFHVFPFVGYVDAAPFLVPQAGEVEDVLEVPFSVFQDEASIQTAEIVLGEHLILRDVPCYRVQGRVVWGATAMIMSELVAVLKQGQAPLVPNA